MNYSIYGPFEIKKIDNRNIIGRDQSVFHKFWEEVEKVDKQLLSACGCYLFAVRAGRGIKPWYVGVADKQTFKKECFAAQKLNIYNEVIAGKKGAPVLFFIAKRTNGNKFTKPTRGRGQTDNKYLESLLIGAALDKNPKLMNIQKTKYLKKMCVPGFLNSPQGKPKKSELAFKKTLE